MLAKIIELVQFKPKVGVTPKQLVQAGDALSDWLKKQPGFISRELGHKQGGEWTDVVYWDDLKNAKAAAEAAFKDPLCLTYFGMIDEESMVQAHYEIDLSRR
jgi:hypothetical protein